MIALNIAETLQENFQVIRDAPFAVTSLMILSAGIAWFFANHIAKGKIIAQQERINLLKDRLDADSFDGAMEKIQTMQTDLDEIRERLPKPLKQATI